MKNLEDGYYIIEFYFYLEDELNVHNTVTVVYTYDFFNKKCLNQVMGNFGYSNFSFFLEYFSEKNRRENCVMIIILMTERLRVILENKNKSAINFNKDTLVVITKSSKEGYEGRDSLINLKYNTPGLSLTGIKRYQNLKKSIKFLHEFIFNDAYVLTTYTLILNYYNKTGENNLAIMIARNIIYQIYKKQFKNEVYNFQIFKDHYSIDNVYLLKFGNIFIELFTNSFENPVFTR